MKKQTLTLSQRMLVAGTLFGMFFGAGNLIFPVHLGQLAGRELLPAIAGFVLTAVGIYPLIEQWGGAGATVPLTGFGYSLAKGVRKAVAEQGFLGIFTGGLTATAGGVTAAIVFGLVLSLLRRPQDKA